MTTLCSVTDTFLDLAEANIRKLNAERAVRQSARWRATNQLWKIIMLSPTPQIADALLQGEHVPIERLDPVWVERFGLRDQDAA